MRGASNCSRMCFQRQSNRSCNHRLSTNLHASAVSDIRLTNVVNSKFFVLTLYVTVLSHWRSSAAATYSLSNCLLVFSGSLSILNSR